MALCGFIFPYYSAPNMTLLQEKVAPEYLGRVLSVFTMLGSIGLPVGMLFFGPMGDIVSIDSLLIWTGVVMCILGMVFFSSKTLRSAGLPVVKAEADKK